MDNISLLIGTLITTISNKYLNITVEPVITMVLTSSLINIINVLFKSGNFNYFMILQTRFLFIKKFFGLFYYNIIVNDESIYYQKILSYILIKYKDKLIQDNADYSCKNENLKNIQFLNETIIENIEKNKHVEFIFEKGSNNIIIRSKELNILQLKNYIKEIISNNSFTTNLNIFLPTISHIINNNSKNKVDEKIVTNITWKNISVHTNKNLANTIVSEKINNELICDLKDFIKSEDFYNKKGIPYKRGYLLYGPPGSGKTSIIKSFASTYGMDIYMINMENIKYPEDITQIFRGFDSICGYHIICFEDIDRCPMFKKEAYLRSYDYNSSVGLRTLLNELDGVVEGNKRITIFTANDISVIEQIDALCRPGRIDKKIEMGYCDTDQICKIFNHYTESNSLLVINKTETIITITPANLIKIILSDTKMLSDDFKKLIIENYNSKNEKNCQSTFKNQEYNEKNNKDRTLDEDIYKKRFVNLINSYKIIYDKFNKEHDRTTELINTIGSTNNIRELKETIPNIIWGRKTSLKKIEANFNIVKNYYDAYSREEDNN
jgi:ATP-dependent 26S proteasome regulatory subunit